MTNTSASLTSSKHNPSENAAEQARQQEGHMADAGFLPPGTNPEAFPPALLAQLRPYVDLPGTIAASVHRTVGASMHELTRRAHNAVCQYAIATPKTKSGMLDHRTFRARAFREVSSMLIKEAKDMQAQTPAYRSAGLDEKSEILKLEDQLELARRWQEHRDYAARDRLLLAFNALAKTKAAEVARKTGMPVEDLRAVARLTMIEIIDKFKPEMGNSFGTFAPPHLKGDLYRYVMDMMGPCRVGTNALDKKVWRGFRQERSSWESRHQRRLDDAGRQEIAETLGVPLEVLKRMEPRMSSSDVSMNETLGDSDAEDSMTRGDLLTDTSATPDVVVMQSLDMKRIMGRVTALLAEMPDRDREIVQARLCSDRKSEFRELSEKYGVSKERIRQLEEKALKSLRKSLEQEGISLENLSLVG